MDKESLWDVTDLSGTGDGYTDVGTRTLSISLHGDPECPVCSPGPTASFVHSLCTILA
jgi:hypothetical protein